MDNTILETEKLDEGTYEIDLGNDKAEIEYCKMLIKVKGTRVSIPKRYFIARADYQGREFESGLYDSETEALKNLSAKIRLSKELNP